MLYSKLFGKTQKQIPQRFESKNHELLIKGGFIEQIGSGIFSLLHLGTIVITKIENIVREEMNKIGAQEILMPSLHPKSLWVQTGRWETVRDLFKVKSRYGQDYTLAGTHEEIVTPLVKKLIRSYRDLPLALYHITPKFRDEPRPKSGILRGREFRMKDLYSFHTSKEDLLSYYQKISDAYLTIFAKCGLKEVKITQASGGSFTKKFSHEFNVVAAAGEVDLIYCSHCQFAQNIEVVAAEKTETCPQCLKRGLKKARAIEIGNIFDLGSKFSEAFDLKYRDKNGKENYIQMGCYGIGTTRLMGAIVEIHNDEKGIIWPKNVAPYQVHLVGLDLKNNLVYKKALEVYNTLLNENVEVLFDDRTDVTAGEKFSDADLIGNPVRLVVSQRTGDKIEYKERKEDKTNILTYEEVLKRIKQNDSSH